MTSIQKQIVIQLKNEGLGYKAISARTGISVNTIKSFCRTHASSETESTTQLQPEEEYCQFCGAKLIQTEHKKKKRFCSDKCRIKYWISHGNSEHATKCLNCGRAFNSIHRGRKFCSHECYIQYRFHGGQHEV